ncbi:hypothetical protein Tco_1071682 [Tanacetum coccineum]
MMQKMIDEYCSRNEIQKMESELWNLLVQGTNIVGYPKRFQELALLCSTMVTQKCKMIKRYIWGLTDHIQRNVTLLKPTRIREAIYMADDLMDQRVRQGLLEMAKTRENRKAVLSRNQGFNDDDVIGLISLDMRHVLWKGYEKLKT